MYSKYRMRGYTQVFKTGKSAYTSEYAFSGKPFGQNFRSKLRFEVVISPILANLFLHYAFDKWMETNHRNKPFARYADDAVAHCRSREEAEGLLKSLETRFTECGLELHPTKTRIVYCKDDDRQGTYTETTFDFLGYTFWARRSKNKYG